MIELGHLSSGRHGALYVAPDSCEAFPADFWSVPTDDQIAEQLRIANTETTSAVVLLRTLGEDGVKLAQLFP